MADFSALEDWSEIDHAILLGRQIIALQKIREVFQGSFREALDLLYARYAFLRETSPEEFLEDHKTYWSDWYS